MMTLEHRHQPNLKRLNFPENFAPLHLPSSFASVMRRWCVRFVDFLDFSKNVKHVSFTASQMTSIDICKCDMTYFTTAVEAREI